MFIRWSACDQEHDIIVNLVRILYFLADLIRPVPLMKVSYFSYHVQDSGGAMNMTPPGVGRKRKSQMTIFLPSTHTANYTPRLAGASPKPGSSKAYFYHQQNNNTQPQTRQTGFAKQTWAAMWLRGRYDTTLEPEWRGYCEVRVWRNGAEKKKYTEQQ